MRRALGIVIMIWFATGRAHAQSTDARAIAEQLFKQARELSRASRWAEACPKFEASLRYEPALGTRINLATCYEHIGKLATAWSIYREVIELATRLKDIKRLEYAQKHAAALEPRLARLAIVVPASPLAGLVVTRDGTPIDDRALGVGLYVDAGQHEITASAPGFEASTRVVTVIDGQTETVVIASLTAIRVPEPEPPKAVMASPVAETSALVAPRSAPRSAAAPVIASSSTRKYVAIGTGIAGLATVGVGLFSGAKAISSYNDAKALCGESLVCGPDSYDQGKQLTRDARSKAAIATVLVAAGGATIVVSAVLLVTAPRGRERTATRLTPMIHDHAAGVAAIGWF